MAVPDNEAVALRDATARLAQAKEAWTQAIHAALDAGASLREAAALAGVSHGTIETIAKTRRS